jgi:putative peptide zinc metalloprotease protein
MDHPKSTPSQDNPVKLNMEQFQKLLQQVETHEIPPQPALASNVELAGEMQETGFKDRMWLIKRDDQFIQVTEMLYRVAETSNGERNWDQIAQVLSETTEYMVTAEHVEKLLNKLIPMGIIATSNGSNPAIPQNTAPSALRVGMRRKVLGENIIDPVAKFFQVLYKPAILVPLLIVIAAAHIWLYSQHGQTILLGLMTAIYKPWQFLVIIGVMMVAGLFHELGHAAALRYGGGRSREAGIGIYLVYPVLYTDTSDNYRLGRWARVRTDLGGFYFYLIFALLMMGLFVLTGQPFLLLVILIINFDILYQSLPFVRFDGYWALADLTGIPDLLSQIGPFLASILPVKAGQTTRLPKLRPWVSTIFGIYILLTIPVLALMFLFALWRMPMFTAITLDSLSHHIRTFSPAVEAGDYLAAGALLIQMGLLLLPLLGVAYLSYVLILAPFKSLWKWAFPSPKRLATGALVASAFIGLIAFLWIPQFDNIRSGVPVGVQTFEVASREHVLGPVQYEQSPPVGGDHAEEWQNCGFYSSPVASENAVHSLEHGAVWVTFPPDLPQDQVEILRRLAAEQEYLLVSPYPGLDAPLVASAWGRQIMLESASDPRLERFIAAFSQAETAPERGGPCIGGIGTPE